MFFFINNINIRNCLVGTMINKGIPTVLLTCVPYVNNLTTGVESKVMAKVR